LKADNNPLPSADDIILKRNDYNYCNGTYQGSGVAGSYSDDREYGSWQRKENVLFSKPSRPDLGYTLPLVQLLQGGYFPGRQSDRRMKLTIHLHILPRLRTGAVTPLHDECVMKTFAATYPS